jgi:hypothetical protein
MPPCNPRRPMSIACRFLLLAVAMIVLSHLRAYSQASTGPADAIAKPDEKTSGPACISSEAAIQQSNAQNPDRDVCVSAHVYNVVEIADGTRFLDVCPPDQPDEACRFTIVSLRSDRRQVGDLNRYLGRNVTVRGIVRSTHGRLGIVLNHVHQLNGGPEKFRPNPRLLHGFNGQSEQLPIRDPNLSSSRHHREFMGDKEHESTSKLR